VPVKEGDFQLFSALDDAKDPDFSYQNTRLSPRGGLSAVGADV